MNLFQTIYNSAIIAAVPLMRLYGLFDEKVREGLAGRKRLEQRLRAFASTEKPEPIVWFHVSSVGEFEQARPVMNRLTEMLDGKLTIVLTFFSPSGLNYYEKHDRSRKNDAIRFVDYLPIDTTGNMRLALESIKPKAIIYTKYDVWPNLAIEASRKHIPQILVSGTLSPGSRNLSLPARIVTSKAYSMLDTIAAISDEDAERFRILARGGPEIIVVGDTRFDQVKERADNVGITLPKAILKSGKKLIIAGSTWPQDEKVVVKGYRDFIDEYESSMLVIVPHEPTAKRIKEIESLLDEEDLTHELLSNIERTERFDREVLIVDGIGFLAELYRFGAVAYVGGGFTTGVHSVLEPAVMGIPIIFGPRHENSNEASALLRLGSAREVKNQKDFKNSLIELLLNERIRQSAGEKAWEFVRRNCGSSQKTASIIQRYLGSESIR